MHVDPNITVSKVRTGEGQASHRLAHSADWTASSEAVDALRRLTAETPRYIARAPGRLDVIGGLADYTGSLVVNTPIARCVYVAAQERTDGAVRIELTESAGLDGDPPTTLSVSDLFDTAGEPVGAEAGCSLVKGVAARTVRCVLGAVVEALRAGVIPGIAGGLTLAISTTLNDITDAGRDAALAAAVVSSCGGMLGVEVDPVEAAEVCRRVESLWLDSPVGPADAIVSLTGQPGSLLKTRCDPCSPVGALRLPDDIAVLGVDCGTVHQEAMLRYKRVRTAAFMGRFIVDRILRHEGGDSSWDGNLARIAITAYVERFRDRIPTKLAGSKFVEHFEEKGDPLARIEPDFVYKIRSRTEHHIYENQRACQFVDCLEKAFASGQDSELVQAGELMYASHWSYGQRCGLGSVETDLLVSLIRRHGADSGIYGAKISGRGSGGVVAVLMRDTDRAEAAIDLAVEDYQTTTGKKATLLRGGVPGALISGARRM